ncbi:MAG: hypothetical protein U0744_17365 [Gemmataceae bacterium]
MTKPGNPPVNVLPQAWPDRDLVSMGNPHRITFVEEITDHLVLSVGPKVEVDPVFRQHQRRVHQGQQPYSTSRCARPGNEARRDTGLRHQRECRLRGGRRRGKRHGRLPATFSAATSNWNGPKRRNHVYMTGPAAEVFAGEWPE